MSLPGSSFEIDADANLKVDVAGNLDWANVVEARNSDEDTGQDDDSYGGGAKEDDPCPSVGTGSIPNNKSDLKTFGVYVEPGGGPGDPGYLHVFWTRVQDPSGTTLMDFEFNQSSAPCGNGANPVRTPGDFLLEYRIVQGGATATLRLRTWNGTAWNVATTLPSPAPIGDINDSPIPVGDSDGLGALSARTFGEASIDLSFIFSGNECKSFGSAFVKSRASDSFTSALKDFIAPTPVSITNCGAVVIRKQTIPDGRPESFAFDHTLVTDPPLPPPSNTFNLADDGVKTVTDVLPGTGYTVTEATADGFELASINCDASSAGVTPVVDLAGRKVTFDINDPLDFVDCTFENRRRRGAIQIVKTRKHAETGSGSYPHAGVTFQVSGGDLPAPIAVVTDAAGIACVDDLQLSSIVGDYTVTEDIPTGYAVDGGQGAKLVAVTIEGSCAAGALGDQVAFTNIPLTTITVTVDSLVPGGTASTITCTGLPVVPTGPGGDGTATLSAVLPGTYTCTIFVDP